MPKSMAIRKAMPEYKQADAVKLKIPPNGLQISYPAMIFRRPPHGLIAEAVPESSGLSSH